MDQTKLESEYKKVSRDIDIKAIERLSRSSKIASITLVPVFFLLFAWGTVRLNSLYREVHELEIRRQGIRAENDSLAKIKQGLEKELMHAYGLSLDPAQAGPEDGTLRNSLLADQALKGLAEGGPGRHAIEVRYYDKTLDEKRVALELEALGYQFKSKPPSEYMSRKETNAVWFGKGVPLSDVKVVALALVRAGIALQGIRTYFASEGNPEYKKNIIEVGASNDLEGKPALTVSEIRNAEAFTRQGARQP